MHVGHLRLQAAASMTAVGSSEWAHAQLMPQMCASPDVCLHLLMCRGDYHPPGVRCQLWFLHRQPGNRVSGSACHQAMSMTMPHGGILLTPLLILHGLGPPCGHCIAGPASARCTPKLSTLPHPSSPGAVCRSRSLVSSRLCSLCFMTASTTPCQVRTATRSPCRIQPASPCACTQVDCMTQPWGL
jgi:hypothetical protein